MLTSLAGPVALAGTIYVAKTGNDANDGLAWATAKLTVQAGLNAAASGDQVWVASGTYTESVALRGGVSLYGGFIGSETNQYQRQPATNVTVLDGSHAGSVVTGPATSSTTTKIDGFTIRNGNAAYGGGVCCSSAVLFITNNTITGNNATSDGGGIYCGSAAAYISDNTIAGNTSSNNGGGIYYGPTSSSSSIDSNTISGNSAMSGGGIYSSGSGFINSNKITGNNGGGICCEVYSTATINNNTILGNSNSGGGGGIRYVGGALPTITNNTIALNSGSSGGGIYSYSYTSSKIVNNIIAFNSSGIRKLSGSPSVRNNCVYGNTDSNYAGLTDPTGTNGNISADPMLAGVLYGNVHIQPQSPCRDAGDDTVVSDSLDIDHQNRIQGTHVDIGADESNGSLWTKGPYAIVRVSPAGNDANSGSSWPLAKRTVQAGLEAAAAKGGEVWVQEGVYPQLITLRPGMHVYGGFVGTETSRVARNWSAHPTVLDGTQLSGSVVTALAGYRASTIDGFVIRNGTGLLAGATTNGGGVFCDLSSPMIVNSTITGNSVTGDGGGVWCTFASWPVIWNTVIGTNSAGHFGGGVYCPISPTIVNSVLTGNQATCGGGLYCVEGTAAITSSTITGNNASGDGGGLYCGPSASLTITNTTVAFNFPGIYKASGSGTPALRYNCVYGNTGYNFSGMTDPTGTNGNISADPRFVSAGPGLDGTWGTSDDTYSDLRLLSGSPCIDAGSNADVPADAADLDGDGNTTEPLPFDLAGIARFLDDPATPNTGAGTPPIVDMGAYEYDPGLVGDINQDSHVDVLDLLRLAGAWGSTTSQSSYSLACDTNRDGSINVIDLLYVADNWGK